MKKTIILTILVLGLLLTGCTKTKVQEALVSSLDDTTGTSQQEKPNFSVVETPHQRVGGSCKYEIVSEGVCKIVRIEELLNTRLYSPQYKIYYKFIPDNKTKDEVKKYISRGDRKFYLGEGSYYPGKKYLEKYNIQINTEFDCVYNKITRGACSPSYIDIKGLDRFDYFELLEARDNKK